MTVILDYGMGNLRSVQKAIESLGFNCSVQPDLKGVSKLLIPGVGAFGAAMERLEPLRDEIRAFAASGKPLLGICLGQQLLFDESEELGQHRGLGLIPGKVKYFPKGQGLKIPHMGWNEVSFRTTEGLGAGLESGDQFYFVHSLYTECENEEHIAGTTRYGIEFASAVQKDNVWGTQFHPEKSGPVGLKVLTNFLKC